jgi:Arc/MetJ-type ribon-helix-helix transcriptional regulator
MPITPQEKTKKVTYTLPETLVAWIEEHAKSLDNSTPEYVVAAVLQEYRKRETKAAAPQKAQRANGQKAAA